MYGIQGGGQTVIIKCAAAFLIFAIAAYLAGAWAVFLPGIRERSKITFSARFATGGCMVILLGMITALAGALFSLSVSAVLIVLTVLMTALCAGGIVMKRRTQVAVSFLPENGMALPDILLAAVSVVLLAVQIYAAVKYSYGQIETVRCIATATKVYDNGYLFVADPMMLLAGTVSSAIKAHPMTFIYNMTCAPLIVFYYMCYLALIGTLLDGRMRTVAFIVIQLLCMRGYQSEMLSVATLTLGWYETPVFVIHGLLNVTAMIVLLYLGNKRSCPDTDQAEDDEITEEWDMKKHKIINARNLAIAVGVLAIALAALVVVLNGKINRLYDVTVKLQDDMDNRCGLYEFSSSDGVIEGYLLKGSDGTLSFVGGGSSKNADKLGEFLADHGDAVTNWYVYGDDEENAGAMRALVSSGSVKAKNIYVIDRKEITGIK